MEDKLKALERRYAHIEGQLGASETYADPELVARLNKEQRELEDIVVTYRQLQTARQSLKEAKELLSDPEL